MLWPILALAEARGILFPWVPVFLAFGIGLWFSLLNEPGVPAYLLASGLLLTALGLWWRGPELAHPFFVAVSMLALGFLAAGLRAHLVAAPVLDFRYYGPVEGRVIAIDRSQSDALRLTLDRVVLSDVSPAKLPEKVRIALHGPLTVHAPAPGEVVQVTAHLSPPEAPVEPGGFDFQRMAWFQGLGAIGYTRHPVLFLADPAPREQGVNRLRAWFSAGVQARIPGDPGAFAAGVMTGDRSGLSLDAVEALRASSLAHLLAISGMNMAFLTGFVFTLIRSGIALVPAVALRINAKKIAAVVSLGVAWFYLLLSGSNVATERAFLMVCVMLGAVLLDRRALSLRSVAMSAVVLLMLRPESLLDPGFQMSFAATTALIAGFGALEGGMLRGRIPPWVMPVFTLVLSSALAGAATAPYGAAHFNRIADFGFVANLLTVPVMGAVVMPAGAVAALLAPLGLADLPLWVMGLGCQWILYVAALVGSWEGAVTAVPSPDGLTLALISLGGIWLSVWRGWGRLAGVLPVMLAFALWAEVQRPDVLIAPDAGLVGVLGGEGRALSVARGAGFAATSWLENDGDLSDQAQAAKRAGFSGPPMQRSFQLGLWRGIHLKGKGAESALMTACAAHDLVIIAARLAEKPDGCRILDQSTLRRSGGLALWREGNALHLVPSRQGLRLWQGNTPPATEAVWTLPNQ
ncbi:MAG: ComEC family competence protein [Gemmobacter sp.]|uniref:ComEC/Rec2 family competence protein n=1 Tax=Gemmobacter sp. TaxID=1898957 RepID=UPI001A48C0B2|nr:ComEC/Rec2 family competence protein [Gemmobacter sp.]MBL8563887.1 ComEC family competence protein [Gemmobacter sp.]